MQKRSVIIAGRHQTSISLEKEFWDALKAIAVKKKITINELITQIDENRGRSGLSGAVRIYILNNLLAQIEALKN